MNRNRLYQWLYSGWPPARAALCRGYTVLLPVPADLPVFLKIAMANIARQDPKDRRETIVLPDSADEDFDRVFHRYLTTWASGEPIRVVRFGPVARRLAAWQRNPHLNYWLQFYGGIAECRTRHALLHDADLFIADRRFLRAHYGRAREEHAACAGVSSVWDSWYRENGMGHLVATWELMLDVEWARGFRPWEHRGHEGEIRGQRHAFDVTLLPQCRTDPSRIVLHQRYGGFIHFNYVISTYRWFQQSRGPFEDEHFRLLLVRLLIDAVDDSGWTYEVPEVEALSRGLRDPGARVTYTAGATAEHYPEFREKLAQLIESEVLGAMASESIRRGVRAFDEAMDWSAAERAGEQASAGDAQAIRK